ncbi:MAG: ABC transporter substrate-binding protein [Anaerolineae bacterium]
MKHADIRVIFPVLLLAITALLSACSPSVPEVSPATPQGSVSQVITVEDALGRSVTLDAPPQRIVIGGKANFMIEDAVYTFPEATDRVIALTKAKQRTTPFISLIDPAHEDKIRFTVESTAEEIATANPDLVFLKRFMRESVGNALEALDIPVVYLDLETPEQYERDLAVLGQIFDNPERADAVWNFYKARMERLDEHLAALDDAPAPDVLVVQYNTKGAEAALEVPPPSWIQTEMVKMTGGNPIWVNGSQGGWTVVNFEQIAAWDPEKILVISYFEDVETVVDQLTSDANWQQLQAVQNEQVFGFPKDFYSWDQPDTRWILGLMWMSTKLHPDLFEDIDVSNEFLQFYTELYALETDTVESEIVPLLEGDLTVR